MKNRKSSSQVNLAIPDAKNGPMMDVDSIGIRRKKKKSRRNLVFDNRFKVIKKLAKGSFGQCYEAIDMQNNDKPVICKINNETEMNDLEGEILKKLNDKKYKNFP